MNENQKKDIGGLLFLAESVLKLRKLDDKHYQDEFEKFFLCLIQGKDVIDDYERRDAGIGDEQWDFAKYKFYNALGRDYGKAT